MVKKIPVHILIIHILIICAVSAILLFFLVSKLLDHAGSAVPEDAGDATVEDQNDAGGALTFTEDGKQRYTHRSGRFSFVYDGELSVRSVVDADTETLFIQNETEDVLELHISTVEDASPITPERIEALEPGSIVENPLSLRIGVDSTIDALMFTSRREGFGRTRELWFVDSGTLFRSISPAGSGTFAGSILESWEFTD